MPVSMAVAPRTHCVGLLVPTHIHRNIGIQEIEAFTPRQLRFSSDDLSSESTLLYFPLLVCTKTGVLVRYTADKASVDIARIIPLTC
jgi:hypothetical protein